METLQSLTSRHAQAGKVVWIGLRPERRAEMVAVDCAEITASGLVGDHRARPGKRAVTLIQAEHLPVIASLIGQGEVTPDILRRNIVVSGFNLSACRNQRLRIGWAEVLITGICAPCSRMESALGPGGYTAVRGHGGMTAEVVAEGQVCLGDPVVLAG